MVGGGIIDRGPKSNSSAPSQRNKKKALKQIQKHGLYYSSIKNKDGMYLGEISILVVMIINL